MSPLVDTSVIYCGDCVDQLRRLPDTCVDLVYIDSPFKSNRNYEVFWGETKEQRSFEDVTLPPRRISTSCNRAALNCTVLKPTGSFYYHSRLARQPLR